MHYVNYMSTNVLIKSVYVKWGSGLKSLPQPSAAMWMFCTTTLIYHFVDASRFASTPPPSMRHSPPCRFLILLFSFKGSPWEATDRQRTPLLRWARSANSMFQSLLLSVSLSPPRCLSLCHSVSTRLPLSPPTVFPRFWPVCLSQKLRYPATYQPPFVPPSFTCCPLVQLCQRVQQLKVSSFFLFRRIVA